MGETHSNTGQQLVTHLLHKVQEYTALHNSPVSETVFTLFSSLSIPSITGQDCGRDLTGEADSSMSKGVSF